MPWLAAAATVLSCGGKALDIGFDRASSSTLGGTGGNATAQGGALPALSDEELAQVQWPPDVPCQAAPESPYVGTWKGHFPDQYGGLESREAVLMIRGLTADGTPCGVLRIGEGEPLAPATDADAIYPPSLPEVANPGVPLGGTSFGPGRTVDAPWPGYEYQLLAVIATEQRLAFGVAYNDILRGWCDLQTQSAGSYACLPEQAQAGPSTNGDPYDCRIQGPDLPPTHVPCFKLDYCNGRCFCYEGSCRASPIGRLEFELHWDDGALEGTVTNTGQLIFLDPVEP